MTPVPAHEEWLAELERAGEVTVRQSRAKVGMGLVAGGAVFLAAGLFLLVTSGRSFTPPPLLRVGGGLAIALAVLFLSFGLAALIRPWLVVRLDQQGLHPPIGPVIPWSEVVDAGFITASTTQLPAVTVAPAYVARDPGLTGWRRKRWELTRSSYGTTIPLRHAPPGGNDEVVRLILAARDRVMGGR